MKTVGKTNRLLRYDLNQIPYDCTAGKVGISNLTSAFPCTPASHPLDSYWNPSNNSCPLIIMPTSIFHSLVRGLMINNYFLKYFILFLIYFLNFLNFKIFNSYMRSQTWTPHNISQFFMVHTVKSFSIINDAKVDFFLLEYLYFLHDPTNVVNLISVSPAFSNLSLYIWKFSLHLLLKSSLTDFEHNFC